jgi:hypothetical protein
LCLYKCLDCAFTNAALRPSLIDRPRALAFNMQHGGVAFLLDIDGVLVRGHNALPCAVPALQAIEAAGASIGRACVGVG